MREDLPIALRPANSDDYGYILASWSREYHKVVPFNFIPNNIYVPHQTEVINGLLKQSIIMVACLDDEPNFILGYLVYQPHDPANIIIHYGEVKSNYRRMGIMKSMLEPLEIENKNLVCSHFFKLFSKLKDKYHLIYDPTLLEKA